MPRRGRAGCRELRRPAARAVCDGALDTPCVQDKASDVSAFNLQSSIARAASRVGSPRRRRSDRGRARMAPEVEAKLHELLLQPDKPAMRSVERKLGGFCQRRGLPTVARASLYNALERVPVPRLRWRSLPVAVQQALYNLNERGAASGDQEIPADQVVFYAFNYGPTPAISFAAGLPWLCLHRAERRPGWRPKSRALLAAVMKYRGI